MKNNFSVIQVYKDAFAILSKKPVRLWGLSLLASFLGFVAMICFSVIPIVAFCISILINTSMTMIFYHGYKGDRDDYHAVDLFDCMKDWKTAKRVLCGTLWSWLWIFLWGLIPIVGIFFALVKGYQYRFVPYILMTQEEVAPTDAIKVSKEQTYGYKGKMFLADILVCIAFGVVYGLLLLLANIPYIGILFALIAIILCILYAVFIGLFSGLVKAAIYVEVTEGPTHP